MTDIRVGDVVRCGSQNLLVIDSYVDALGYSRIRVLDTTWGNDTGTTVCVRTINMDDARPRIIPTDTHIQIVEDIMSQIKNAKVIENK